MDKKRNTPGVHMTSMDCADCHSKKEVHGDGKCYKSMREAGAMDTKCSNCHKNEEGDYPAVPKTKSHTVHKDKLDCAACHVQNSMTCYNCHFGVLKETGKKSESFMSKAKDFLLLVKYDGKVTSGTMQTLVGPDNYPFITYVPYLTHSIAAEGRKCEQCHATEAVEVIASGKPFTPATLSDKKLKFYPGVIPVVPQSLNWLFFDKKNNKWQPFKPTSAPLVQMGVYAEPLSGTEIKKMQKKQKY